MEVIASRKNPLVAQMRRVASGEEPDRMLLEGWHLIEEARAAHVTLTTVACSSRALAAADVAARRLATTLAGVGVRVVQVSDGVIEAMSPVSTPSGIVAIAARPRHAIQRLLPPETVRPFILVAIDVQDPGNVGAITRVAEAAGAAGVIAAGSSADPFGWKALRGAMGSAFRLPVIHERDTDAALDTLASHGVTLAATAPIRAEPFERVDWTGAVAVLLGSEGTGLSDTLLARASVRVSIPMQAPVESLNVAVAAALLAYEARRQRTASSSRQPVA